MEPGDHLFDILGYVQGVGLARRLVGERAFLGHPIVLQVVPAPLEHDRVDTTGVPVTGQHAGLPHSQEVDVIAAAGVEQERLERYRLGDRNPEFVIFQPLAHDTGKNQVRGHEGHLRQLVRNR
ncbi:hypothetical protein D3C80_1586520 [compost metagenome]